MPPPPPLYQSALFAGPGRFPALALYKIDPDLIQNEPDPQSRARRLRGRIAALMRLVEANDLATEHVLVSVAPAVLQGHPDQLPPHSIEPSHPGMGFQFAFGSENDYAVALQIAAETAEDRVHGLRLCRAVLEENGELKLGTEVFGDVRTGYREPFGYPDSRKGHTKADVARAALVPSGPLAGSSWIFYQRMVQKLPKFFTESPDERNAILGIDTRGHTHPGDPSITHARGHVKLTREKNRDADGRPIVVRRGFPFRTSKGEEGLVFIGASQAAMQMKEILEQMLGGDGNPIHDALLHFVESTHGGIFFVPASSDWLARQANVPQPSVPKEVEEITRPGDEALLLYPFTPKGLEYMNRMRDELIFGDPVGRLDPVPNPDDEIDSDVSNTAHVISEFVHTKIAGGTWSIDDLLPKMDQWVIDIGGLPGTWQSEAPAEVVTLVQTITTLAGSGSLTAALVRGSVPANGPLLMGAIQKANETIASGMGRIPAPVRDLINATSHVVTGVVPPNEALKQELDTLRDESLAASKKVNDGEGYYITISV